MRDFITDKLKNIKPSGIRKFFDIVAASGGKIISLGVGDPDFSTPWEIRNAGALCLQKGITHYTSNIGLPELRGEISRYLADRFRVRFAADEIMLTIGASEAIDLTLRAVTEEGDEVLIPDPSYVSYAPCVQLCGGTPVAVPCSAENGFKLTPGMLEKKITPKTSSTTTKRKEDIHEKNNRSADRKERQMVRCNQLIHCRRKTQREMARP